MYVWTQQLLGLRLHSLVVALGCFVLEHLLVVSLLVLLFLASASKGSVCSSLISFHSSAFLVIPLAISIRSTLGLADINEASVITDELKNEYGGLASFDG